MELTHEKAKALVVKGLGPLETMAMGNMYDAFSELWPEALPAEVVVLTLTYYLDSSTGWFGKRLVWRARLAWRQHLFNRRKAAQD